MMRSPLFLALALAVGAGAPLLAGDANAQTTRAVRATTELSMTLTGKIEVTAEGAVSALVLDQKANISPGVAAFVERTIRPWRFEPTRVDGKAVPALRMAIFANTIRDFLGLDHERYMFFCGMAIGTRDPDAPVNNFERQRVPLEDHVKFIGFA